MDDQWRLCVRGWNFYHQEKLCSPIIKILQTLWVLCNKTRKWESLFHLFMCGKRQEIDHEETSSPVTYYYTIQTLLAVPAAEKMKPDQFDIKTAFLNGVFKEGVYVKQPEGAEDDTGRVCLLNKILGSNRADIKELMKTLKLEFHTVRVTQQFFESEDTAE
ncbi:uncharacterized protein LOC126298261 [Schistocerca gregaria]|uniref:uncharacterized protein LOC126298261 n=1 Tax=Schistocerca gregaria TaxID=7010 RepID=UPI00211EE4F0|nr:uncharacterized protein LOC126298261 [Schistocerca gregaria]